jgi:hypothetical protein
MNRNNCRILVNPDLSAVEGIEPHFWKFEAGKVIAMNQKEKIVRYEDILKNGADTKLNDIYKETIQYNVIHWGWATSVAFGGMIVGLLIAGGLYRYW